MNLKEFKTCIDSIYDRLTFSNPEDISVVITTSEPSFGGRACSGINNVHLGFDWEHNQLRINPQKQLVLLGRDMSDEREMYNRVYSNKTCYFCPRCDCFVGQKDNFCRHCGQKFLKVKI